MSLRRKIFFLLETEKSEIIRNIYKVKALLLMKENRFFVERIRRMQRILFEKGKLKDKSWILKWCFDENR